MMMITAVGLAIWEEIFVMILGNFLSKGEYPEIHGSLDFSLLYINICTLSSLRNVSIS